MLVGVIRRFVTRQAIMRLIRAPNIGRLALSCNSVGAVHWHARIYACVRMALVSLCQFSEDYVVSTLQEFVASMQTSSGFTVYTRSNQFKNAYRSRSISA